MRNRIHEGHRWFAVECSYLIRRRIYRRAADRCVAHQRIEYGISCTGNWIYGASGLSVIETGRFCGSRTSTARAPVAVRQTLSHFWEWFLVNGNSAPLVPAVNIARKRCPEISAEICP